MNENFKILRKMLGLSQAEFGAKIGVSRDVIGNIEYDRVEPKDVFISHVCAVFNVNEEWLRTGNGEPFNSDKMLARDLDEAVSSFSKLSPILQDYALQQLRGLLDIQNRLNTRELMAEKTN